MDPESIFIAEHQRRDERGGSVRLARLAVAADSKWVKLEIHPDPRFLLPDPIETLSAAEQLVKLRASRGAAAHQRRSGAGEAPGGRSARQRMPLAPLIGSHRGPRPGTSFAHHRAGRPFRWVVDAGIGAPSHAAEAMELGADAVLVNTAIAVASDPNRMAVFLRQAVEAGARPRVGLGEVRDMAGRGPVR